MESNQLTHHEVKNAVISKEIIVITQNIRTPENVGMIFRVSEAFGVKKVILVGQSPNLSNKRVVRTARSTEKELKIQIHHKMESVIAELKQANYKLIGLELTNTSTKIQSISFFKYKKIALFIGAERFGIDQTTLQQLDAITHISLFGKNSSINVVNALAVALYEITK